MIKFEDSTLCSKLSSLSWLVQGATKIYSLCHKSIIVETLTLCWLKAPVSFFLHFIKDEQLILSMLKSDFQENYRLRAYAKQPKVPN